VEVAFLFAASGFAYGFAKRHRQLRTHVELAVSSLAGRQFRLVTATGGGVAFT
jgi:hypothetical protein